MITRYATPHARESRCAIYTRRSLEPYADQEFNSLQVQREICSSYIASQRPKGWKEIPKHYDDAGRTGANLQRPSLQELLTDIETGLVDVVVIYKLDRITRTLLDFVRLIDLFDQYGVSFVSVTQNFDTADSTGRLILNVLLTFAQFEREITSDRLRDRFSAMRERGMFVGGNPPFGYDLGGKQLIVNSSEAKIVRWAFRRYLQVASYVKVSRELKARGVTRRSRVSKRGNLVRGRHICTASVWNMLGNPVYVGDVRNRGKRFAGIHKAIVSQRLWDQVQRLRAQRTRAKVVEVHKTDLLRGLLSDSYGRPMGVFRDYRYNKEGTRYYISNQSEWGRRHGARRFRTKADQLEELVMAAILSMLSDRERVRVLLLRLGVHDKSLNKLTASGAHAAKLLEQATLRQKQCALKSLIERIELSSERITIVIRTTELPQFLVWDGVGLFSGDQSAWSRPHRTDVIDVPAATIRMKRELTLLAKQRMLDHNAKPDKYLVSLLRKARAAQGILDERSVETVTNLAARIGCHPNRFSRLVRLNYLAPDIIAAILDGTQPPELKGGKLMATELPMDWSLQRRVLGFADQPDFLKAAPGW